MYSSRVNVYTISTTATSLFSQCSGEKICAITQAEAKNVKCVEEIFKIFLFSLKQYAWSPRLTVTDLLALFSK